MLLLSQSPLQKGGILGFPEGSHDLGGCGSASWALYGVEAETDACL